MTKKEKTIISVWEPTIYETMIGAQMYQLRPQPIKAVMRFDTLLEEVSQLFEEGSNGYDVFPEGGGEPLQHFDTEGEAQTYIDAREGEKLYISATRMTAAQILEQLSDGPYHIMKPMIPDLKREDVQDAPMGQIEHVIGLLVEVNGMKWFEGMVKNFLEPLLPKLIASTAEALSEVFSVST